MFDGMGAGQAIIFMSALLGMAIAGPMWLTYTSHCFLTVVTETSTGHPDVNWPSETFADWWWKPLYCVGMLTFWLTGGSVIIGPLALVGPWPFAIAASLFIWYAYPIGMLGVLDAGNSMSVVHLPLLIRLLRQPGAVLLVGLMTLPLGVVVVGLFVLMVRYSMWFMVPIAFVLPIALLLYSRAWGRLAWMVLNVKGRRKREEDTPPPPEAADAIVHDPWAAPAPDEVPELDVEMDEPPPDPDDEWATNPVPYSVPAPEPAAIAEPPAFSHEQYYADYRKREELRKARAEGRTLDQAKRRRRATVGNAFGVDFWVFLAGDHTLRVGLNLAVLTLAFLGLLGLAISVSPWR
jgi:hypothetical protein